MSRTSFHPLPIHPPHPVPGRRPPTRPCCRGRKEGRPRRGRTLRGAEGSWRQQGLPVGRPRAPAPGGQGRPPPAERGPRTRPPEEAGGGTPQVVGKGWGAPGADGEAGAPPAPVVSGEADTETPGVGGPKDCPEPPWSQRSLRVEQRRRDLGGQGPAGGSDKPL